ncbi:SDR family oxidoreductase [Bacillaceae bacterium SIJ1]|uniref:SDR family oxidoreductase n=1 Tax=Litoribacterium kuwaitense TaxID=1398745 RepID=UPI0013EC552E|nr:SDR family oxidoreductase [Litoribacterium kuwaitense]NGP45471.1 SDR family oxidoreductase [Litoribacterium kuwaitense]
MRVLVAGSHGHTGQLVLQKLQEKGHGAFGMIRDEEQIDTINELGATAVVADLEDDVSSAVVSMDAIIFAAGSGSHTGKDKTEEVDRDGAIRLIEAAQAMPIQKFVMLSSVGADKPEKMPEEIRHYMDAKHDADEMLVESGLDYTIVRPGRLSHEPGQGMIRANKKLTNYEGSVSREDVALALVESLNTPLTSHLIFEMLDGDTPVKEAITTV